MTMEIRIKNVAQEWVASIQYWGKNVLGEPHALETVEQLLPGEEKSIYIHSTKYVTIEECEHKEG
jgi:hypothetical protein